MSKTNTAKPQIELVSTADLTPYPTNSKVHSDAKIEAVANAIRQFGFTAPVLIDEGNVILAGHCRVTAAQSIEFDPVPCVRLKHLSDTQKRAYVIADNRLAEFGSEWDEDMLALELKALEVEDFDLSMIGFDDLKVSLLLGEATTTDLSKEWEASQMPEYDGSPEGSGTIIVHFTNPTSRASFAKALQIKITENAKFCWYPSKP